jgi:hypothetical protein
MSRWTLIAVSAALALCVGRVDAQQMAVSPPPDEAMVILKTDFGRLGADVSEVLAGKDREIAALKKHDAELDAWLKACGDKSGCTVPAQ